jgi:hypothetical protein
MGLLDKSICSTLSYCMFFGLTVLTHGCYGYYVLGWIYESVTPPWQPVARERIIR